MWKCYKILPCTIWMRDDYWTVELMPNNERRKQLFYKTLSLFIRSCKQEENVNGLEKSTILPLLYFIRKCNIEKLSS